MAVTIRTTGFEDYLDPSGAAFFKVLMLGHPDTGKTRSASFWPSPIFLDSDPAGRMSIADRKMPYAEIRSVQDMKDSLAFLRMESARPAGQRRYQTVVVDTLDSFQRIAMREILTRTGNTSLRGWEQWGELDSVMSWLFDSLAALKMNVIVNVHIKESMQDGDGDTKMTVRLPRLKGDSKDRASDDFALVGCMEKYWGVNDQGQRVTKRRVRWHSDPEHPMLEDKSGRLPQFTEIDFTEDDYQRVFGAIVHEGIDQLQERETLVAELPTADDDDVPPTRSGEVAGGPVSNPKVPKPAKKTAAKKTSTAAKKAAPVPPPTEVREPAPPPVVETREVGPAADPPTLPTTGGAGTTASSATSPEQAAGERPSGAGATEEELEAAKRQAAETLGAEVVAESPAEPEQQQAEQQQAEVCGFQPSHMTGRADPVQGCGAALEQFPTSLVNLALVRTKTKLCPACFDTWKRAA